jgi:Tfp pilus assembly protein PilW
MRHLDINDESGTTLVELLVAISAGTVVFFGLTMLVLASMHTTTRVTNRVHATQNARTAVQGLMTELHSACVAPQLAPVQEKSTGTTLSFIHAYGSEVIPTPILSTVTLSGTTLTQTDYAKKSGTAADPEFNTTPVTGTPRALTTNVSAISSSIPVFSYYSLTGGQVSSTSLTTPLSEEGANTTSQVNIALKVTVPGSPVTDPHGAAQIQDSALLRLTPPNASAGALNPPCE